MRRIRWSPAAADDLQGLRDFLRTNHPSMMRSTISKLYKVAGSLKRFPNRGRIGRKEGTRELLTNPLPYVIVYSVGSEMIHILRIIHTAREEFD